MFVPSRGGGRTPRDRAPCDKPSVSITGHGRTKRNCEIRRGEGHRPLTACRRPRFYRLCALTNYYIRYNLILLMGHHPIKLSLSGSGLRSTPQRYALMAFLMEQEGHPTAAEIFEAVNRLDPRSSRATIYNNLRDLVQAGLVREVAAEGRAARFDARGTRHHHFICDRCGNVEDIDWYDVPRPVRSSLGKRVLRQCDLILRGLCVKCAPRRASR